MLCHKYCLISLIVALTVLARKAESFPHPPSRSRSLVSLSKTPPNTSSQLGAFLDMFRRGGATKKESSTNTPIKTETVDLSTGISAEVMSCVTPASKRSGKPPLVFIHGSFHAAWCWTERYFPYFASKGYPCIALSLRGTGGTFAGEGVKKVKIAEHVADVSALLDCIALKGEYDLGKKPVLISHSFGGLSAMKFVEDESKRERLSGVAMLCSVPPSGIMKMTMRCMLRSPVDAFRTTAGLAMKKALTDEKLCRIMFFGGNAQGEDEMAVSGDDLARYQSNFRRDTIATIDLGDLSKQLPSACAGKDGRASFVSSVPPSLVVGAHDDFIVDKEGVEETARFFGVEPVFVDSPHDVMLTNKWQNGADAILSWLENEVVI